MKKLLCLLISIIFLFGFKQNDIANPEPTRFQNQINSFVQWDQKNSFPTDAILFVGSSSIRLWQTSQTFPEYSVINRGFGGSHISDVIHYYPELIKKYKPSIIVFYAGDNDIAFGKSANQVFEDYKQIVSITFNDNPDVKFVFISIKPSSSRWKFWDNMHKSNELIKKFNKENNNLYYLDLASPLLDKSGKPNDELFLDDMLHLNEKGYSVWKSFLKPLLDEIINE